LAPWARSGSANDMAGLQVLSGTDYALHVDHAPITVDGRGGAAIAVNGQVPAPLLRWHEGDEVTLRVTNHLDADTSIHWHGILLPFQMDGVPGVTFPGIRPGETFEYRFPLKQAGTYWYHSHSGTQEQSGHYGPIVIDPAGPDPVRYDREYVIVLSDWTFERPDRVFARLKKSSEAYNYQRRTLGDFFAAADRDGLGGALRDFTMWGRMRMDMTDIADVTGATYTYLVNGHGPEANWTGLFEPGQRVRLRFINASAMTIFNVRIPELPMTFVQADGLDVKPVTVDEFQIGVAETYDVVVATEAARAYTVMCESIDRSGYARATLAPRPGMAAPVPPLRPRPSLTMKDMGMAHHGSHAMATASGHAGHAAPATDEHAGHAMASMDEHGGHEMHSMSAQHGDTAHGQGGDAPATAHDHRRGPGVVNTAEAPADRLGEPGIGLENQPHRVLTYRDLQSLAPNPDRRPPERELELHLTSNMERYMWSFDGLKFSEVTDSIRLRRGERVRLILVNDTMMSHPIHLHGMYFDVVTGDHAHKPRKHTIIVKPGERLSVDVSADAEGDWAFHCHLLYHMLAGMMRVVSVVGADGRNPADKLS
ncbi:MAG: copper resistance system multicopper oxidase, partial [Gammaproteobacteria bacterium]|nr:copper resistance system multicopper oxidase [Gammaproteobacteria bacterium]